MIYMGSKNRFSKIILDIILNDNRYNSNNYIEPFAGGCNLIDKVPSSFNRYANDINYFLMYFLDKVSKNPSLLPKEPLNITRMDWNTHFYYYKNNIKVDSFKTGLIGSLHSFSGKMYDSFADFNTVKGSEVRVKRSYSNLRKQIPYLKGIKFSSNNYNVITIPKGSIIYCDPPYYGVKRYINIKFDHASFWAWVRTLSTNCTVYVSEYTAPSDFQCVHIFDSVQTIRGMTGKRNKLEKLFKWKS